MAKKKDFADKFGKSGGADFGKGGKDGKKSASAKKGYGKHK